LSDVFNPPPRRDPSRRRGRVFAADGADEEGTLERLKALRAEVIDPKITEHRGRIVKTTGDGLLVEFGSVVDALRCAVEVQREMAGRSTPVPLDNRIEFRIGINVGDIVVEDGDIFGDGVNSQHGSKAWPSRAASASPRAFGRTLRAASISPLKTWATRRSRTSRGLSEPTA
jgi:hypothetical protein